MTEPTQPSLARVVGFVGITVYAVGDILGAGIYALVGRVAGIAGGAAWISFLLAAVFAAVTGLSYAEMVSRHPVAAGASAYASRAFGRPLVSFLAGFLVLASGLTSAATVSRAFVGYLDSFVVLPPLVASVALLAALTALNYRGIEESTRINFVLTAIEVLGLVVVIGAGVFAMTRDAPAGVTGPTLGAPTAILAGTTVAFFAYIGFEDTVNVAEEVKDAARVVPRAIVVAIAVTTVIYLAVMVLALFVVPSGDLAGSGAPLLLVVQAAGVPFPERAFSFIALMSITNTGLLNLVMASRLGYGMAREGLLPEAVGRVHERRRTPFVAVLLAFLLAAALATTGGVTLLAQTTSLLLLAVFSIVHVALLTLQRRGGEAPSFRAPRWTPAVGLALCVALMTSYPAEVHLRAAIVIALGALLHFLFARRRDPS